MRTSAWERGAGLRLGGSMRDNVCASFITKLLPDYCTLRLTVDVCLALDEMCYGVYSVSCAYCSVRFILAVNFELVFWSRRECDEWCKGGAYFC